LVQSINLILALVILASTSILSRQFLTETKRELLQEVASNNLSVDRREEVQYLPQPKAVKLLSFGYHNVLAHIIWFYSQNYFGKHYRSDQDYRWLSYMLDLITDLDPKNKSVYQFGSLILGWEAHLPEQAYKLLAKAIINDPKDWYFYFLRGSLRYLVSDDPIKAMEDFKISAALPDAPPMIGTIAAKKIATTGENPQEAALFLRALASQFNNPLAEETLIKRAQEIERKILER
jgi:hypothetical protein